MLNVYERAYAPNSKMPAHAHPWPSMSLIVRGALEENCGRRSEIARRLSVSLMGADITHQDSFGPLGATMLSVIFEGDWLEEAGIRASGLREWRWTPMGPVARVLLQLRVAMLHGAGSEIVEQHVIDALAADDGNPSLPRSVPPRWLRRVRDAIDDNAHWPRVDELAQLAEVHRVHLAREFRRYFGCSVSVYIRRRAIQRAAERMGTSRATLADAAHGSGFSDHSHMCQAFRREMGLSPTQARIAMALPGRGA